MHRENMSVQYINTMSIQKKWDNEGKICKLHACVFLIVNPSFVI